MRLKFREKARKDKVWLLLPAIAKIIMVLGIPVWIFVNLLSGIFVFIFGLILWLYWFYKYSFKKKK